MVPFESTIPTTAIDPIKLPSEKKGLHSDFEQAIFNEDAGLREAAVPPCLKKTIVILHLDSNPQAFHVCLSDKGRGFARNPCLAATRASNSIVSSSSRNLLFVWYRKWLQKSTYIDFYFPLTKKKWSSPRYLYLSGNCQSR